MNEKGRNQFDECSETHVKLYKEIRMANSEKTRKTKKEKRQSTLKCMKHSISEQILKADTLRWTCPFLNLMSSRLEPLL